MKKKIQLLIAVLISAALIFLVLLAVKVMNVDSVHSEGKEASREVAVGTEIEIGKEKLLVAESEGKLLYVNPEDLNLIVEDKDTGTVWSAIDPEGSEKEKALLSFNYVGEDNTFYEWDSYTYCTANESYKLYQLENGVRIVMNINEGASARFYEYMPQKMSIAHYEEVFLAGLEQLVEAGELEKSKAAKLKSTLGLIYKKSKDTNSYNVSYVGQPPKSAVTQLIELSQLVNYTTEMLMADAEEFDFEVEFTEPAIFDITMDVTLEGDELVVNIPVQEIVNGNEFFTLQNMEVLTNFGMVAADSVTEGYFLLPDGAGALLQMNSYDTKVPDYVRGFYNNDFYTDYYYKPEFSQELMMPVFGMLYMEGTKAPHGFMSVVENGADAAYLETMVAAGGEGAAGRNYNKIYTTYDISQYEWVPVFGEYSDNTSTFLSMAPRTQEDYTLRYFFYTGDGVSYYNMAKDYREYLCGGKAAGIYSDKAELFLEVIGTLSLEERFLGIPYNSEYSMTTYQELADILTDLEGRHANVAYKGVFDRGMNHKLMNRGELVSKNGTAQELEALNALIEGAGAQLFMETDFMKVYDTGGNGFVKWLHGLEDYSKSVAEMYGYRVELGIFKQRSNMYHLLDPQYLVDVVSDFKENVEGSYNYYVNDTVEQYYADYGNEYISPFEAQRIVNQALDVLEQDSALALDNPRADKLTKGTVAVDISRESSELVSFYTSIPFRQLVLNGMMEYTTTTANNNSDSARYYLMQAIETGAQPKFTISAKSVDVLKDTAYSYYFSIQYDLLKDDIKAVYDAYAEAMEKIGTTEIANHTMLAKDVFLTEYANGTLVVTNYTFDAFDYKGTAVMGNDYLIMEGGN